MSEFGTAVPTGGDAPQPAGPAPGRPSMGAQIGWGLVSTALLAGWIAFQWGWVWALAGVFGSWCTKPATWWPSTPWAAARPAA